MVGLAWIRSDSVGRDPPFVIRPFVVVSHTQEFASTNMETPRNRPPTGVRPSSGAAMSIFKNARQAHALIQTLPPHQSINPSPAHSSPWWPSARTPWRLATRHRSPVTFLICQRTIPKFVHAAATPDAGPKTRPSTLFYHTFPKP